MKQIWKVELITWVA